MALDESETQESAETDEQEMAEEKDEYNSREYWQRWINGAKAAAEQHWNDAKAAWAEYEHPANKDDIRNAEKTASYPIYWSSCKTIEPALYSRTPKVVSRRRFEFEDDIASLACEVNERLGQYLVDTGGFDAVMMAAVGDFIHADKATTQIVYEHDTEEQQNRVVLTQAATGEFVNAATGEVYPGEVYQDDQGLFGVEVKQVPTNQKIYAAPTSFDEVLHTPDARTQAEIKEMAFFFSLCEDEAEKRFGEDKCKDIRWKVSKSFGDENDRDTSDIPGKYIEGWEIYHKGSKRVYWYSDQYANDLLDVKDDPYGFINFFPAPEFIIGSKPHKSLFPTPAFIHCRDAVRALHEQAHKVYELIGGIRRRCLVDGSLPDVIAALQDSGDNEFIAVKNIQAIVEKGGLNNVIQYIPVQELVAAIGELSSLEDKFKNSFYEWFGVPDILRGASDPIETAAAQEVKAASAHDRFKYQKKQVAQLARDTVDLMLDIAYEVFDANKIASIAGIGFMPPERQQLYPAALQLLKTDDERLIRTEIDTDSMSFLDSQLKAQRVSQAAQVVTAGLQSIAQMAQGDPKFLPVGLQTLLASLESMDAGRQFSDSVKKVIEQLIKEKENPPEAPPPPPDYEKMKLDLQAQKQQMDMIVKQKELEQKELKMSIDAQKTVADTQLEQQKAQMERAIQQFSMTLEAQRLQLESFQVQMQARESEMEEIRLAREADLNSYKAAVETAKNTAPAEPQPPQIINIQPPPMPPISINVEAAKPTMKKIDVLRDAAGNALGYNIGEVPQPSIAVPVDPSLGLLK